MRDNVIKGLSMVCAAGICASYGFFFSGWLEYSQYKQGKVQIMEKLNG